MATQYADVIRVFDIKANFTGDKIKVGQFGWSTDTKEFVCRDSSGYTFVGIPSGVKIGEYEFKVMPDGQLGLLKNGIDTENRW